MCYAMYSGCGMPSGCLMETPREDAEGEGCWRRDAVVGSNSSNSRTEQQPKRQQLQQHFSWQQHFIYMLQQQIEFRITFGPVDSSKRKWFSRWSERLFLIIWDHCENWFRYFAQLNIQKTQRRRNLGTFGQPVACLAVGKASTRRFPHVAWIIPLQLFEFMM